MSILTEPREESLPELYDLYLAGGVGFENIIRWCKNNFIWLVRKDRTNPKKYYFYIHQNSLINRIKIESKCQLGNPAGYYERFEMVHTLSKTNLRTNYPTPHVTMAKSYTREIKNDSLAKMFAYIFEIPENLYEELKQISLCHLKNQ